MRTLALTLTAALTIAIVLIAGRPFDVSATPQPEATSEAVIGDAEHGKELFKNGVDGAPACTVCHATSKGFGFGNHLSGPNLQGVGERAGERVEGLTAEEYITQSILQPSAFVVEGYANIMYPNFADHLSEQDTADLVAYLMTL